MRLSKKVLDWNLSAYVNDKKTCMDIGERGTTYWIHFAVRPKENRRKILWDCQ